MSEPTSINLRDAKVDNDCANLVVLNHSHRKDNVIGPEKLIEHAAYSVGYDVSLADLANINSFYTKMAAIEKAQNNIGEMYYDDNVSIVTIGCRVRPLNDKVADISLYQITKNLRGFLFRTEGVINSLMKMEADGLGKSFHVRYYPQTKQYENTQLERAIKEFAITEFSE